MMRIISASNQISFLVALLMLLFSSLPFSVYIFPLKGRNVEENFQRKNRRNERHIELESSYNLRHSNGKQIKFLSTHLFFLLLFHSHSNSNKMKNHFHHPHSAHNVWIFIASYVSVVQSEFGIQCRRMCERKKAVNMIITCHWLRRLMDTSRNVDDDKQKCMRACYGFWYLICRISGSRIERRLVMIEKTSTQWKRRSAAILKSSLINFKVLDKSFRRWLSSFFVLVHFYRHGKCEIKKKIFWSENEEQNTAEPTKEKSNSRESRENSERRERVYVNFTWHSFPPILCFRWKNISCMLLPVL